MGAPLGQARLHRQHRLGAIQRLDLAFLIDAQHHRVLGRVQIQAHDVGDLGDQFGVGGEFERLGSPRLYSVLTPRLGYRELQCVTASFAGGGFSVADTMSP